MSDETRDGVGDAGKDGGSGSVWALPATPKGGGLLDWEDLTDPRAHSVDGVFDGEQMHRAKVGDYALGVRRARTRPDGALGWRWSLHVGGLTVASNPVGGDLESCKAAAEAALLRRLGAYGRIMTPRVVVEVEEGVVSDVYTSRPMRLAVVDRDELTLEDWSEELHPLREFAGAVFDRMHWVDRELFRDGSASGLGWLRGAVAGAAPAAETPVREAPAGAGTRVRGPRGEEGALVEVAPPWDRSNNDEWLFIPVVERPSRAVDRAPGPVPAGVVQPIGVPQAGQLRPDGLVWSVERGDLAPTVEARHGRYRVRVAPLRVRMEVGCSMEVKWGWRLSAGDSPDSRIRGGETLMGVDAQREAEAALWSALARDAMDWRATLADAVKAADASPDPAEFTGACGGSGAEGGDGLRAGHLVDNGPTPSRGLTWEVEPGQAGGPATFAQARRGLYKVTVGHDVVEMVPGSATVRAWQWKLWWGGVTSWPAIERGSAVSGRSAQYQAEAALWGRVNGFSAAVEVVDVPAAATTNPAPANAEAEQAVLGSILIDPAAIIRVACTLQPEDFSDPRHAIIFSAMRRLYNRGQTTGLMTLLGELEREDQLEKAGGTRYIAGLRVRAPRADHVEHYAGLVERAAMRRRLIDAAEEISGIANDDTADEARAKEEPDGSTPHHPDSMAAHLDAARVDPGAGASLPAGDRSAEWAALGHLSDALLELVRAMGGPEMLRMIAAAGGRG